MSITFGEHDRNGTPNNGPFGFNGDFLFVQLVLERVGNEFTIFRRRKRQDCTRHSSLASPLTYGLTEYTNTTSPRLPYSTGVVGWIFRYADETLNYKMNYKRLNYGYLSDSVENIFSADSDFVDIAKIDNKF